MLNISAQSLCISATYTHVTLLQVPNFLHLTPAAIKKHCEALKRMSYIIFSPNKIYSILTFIVLDSHVASLLCANTVML